MELVDFWSFGHALTGLAIGWMRIRFAPVLALGLGWELAEPSVGPWGADPSFPNSCVDIAILAGGWAVGRASRPRAEA